MKINYVTGNKNKFAFAERMLEHAGIILEQKNLDIPEIQDSDYHKISIDKAKKAFEILQEPLFITDSSWEIPALNGFPGAFMKYVNNWFTALDWLNLMKDKTDRKILAIDNIVYIDKNGWKKFEWVLEGEIANETYHIGSNELHKIVKFDGKYIEENNISGEKIQGEGKVWGEFAEFLKSKSL